MSAGTFPTPSLPRRFSRGLIAALLALACGAQAQPQVQTQTQAQPPASASAPQANGAPARKAQPFSFALIGDLPYGPRDELNLQEVLTDIGNGDAAFVIHAGDIKAGNESCADALLQSRKALLNAARQPLVLVPGDNEWTDCHRKSNGGYDPVERLNRLRELFFSDSWSLGQERMKLLRQSEHSRFRQYPENVRWEFGNVLFVGLNVPGSNNNYLHDGGRNGEFEDRREANRYWLSRAFQIARQQQLAAVVLIIQGNPHFENNWQQNRTMATLLDGLSARRHRDGYLEFKRQLQELVPDFPGQVLLVHGDTHSHKIDKPLRDEAGKVVENFTRIETFGYPHSSNWVRVTVDAASEAVFAIEARRLQLPPQALTRKAPANLVD